MYEILISNFPLVAHLPDIQLFGTIWSRIEIWFKNWEVLLTLKHVFFTEDIWKWVPLSNSVLLSRSVSSHYTGYVIISDSSLPNKFLERTRHYIQFKHQVIVFQFCFLFLKKVETLIIHTFIWNKYLFHLKKLFFNFYYKNTQGDFILSPMLFSQNQYIVFIYFILKNFLITYSCSNIVNWAKVENILKPGNEAIPIK